MSNYAAPFDWRNFELKDSSTVEDWGKTLVFAPHPDDESLGCGGAIALLRKAGVPVRVVTMSDGTLSHPNSRKFPPEKLRALREAEMRGALEILGVAASEISFLRYPDRSVPDEDAAGFAAAVERIARILDDEKPLTILAPWRRDPHPDHRATCRIVRAAVKKSGFERRLLEYPIWLWELAGEADWPSAEKTGAWRLDISAVTELKRGAIAAHASQTTDLIDDDPQGFRLSPEILSNFFTPYEIFLEEIKQTVKEK